MPLHSYPPAPGALELALIVVDAAQFFHLDLALRAPQRPFLPSCPFPGTLIVPAPVCSVKLRGVRDASTGLASDGEVWPSAFFRETRGKEITAQRRNDPQERKGAGRAGPPDEVCRPPLGSVGLVLVPLRQDRGG